MKDYKKLVDGLRHCTTVDGCKGCPFDDPADLLCECSNKVCTGAADAIESLLKGLHETKSDLEAAVRGQETLQKALADVKAERSWISVKERLPDDEKAVLCWYEYFRYGDYNRMFQTFGIGFFIDGNWGGEVSSGVKCRVLYWMPLPDPPENSFGQECCPDQKEGDY